jgi:splicing factor 45
LERQALKRRRWYWYCPQVTLPNWPAQEVVRIFVEFTRSESAMKGLIDLDGRFFGGRTVHASFFDEDRFAQTQLAPHDDEERL